MKFGENLYHLRKKQKISQEKLAEKMDVSRQSVSKWETGAAYPEMHHILELCKIFHCQLNDLVSDKILDYDSLDEEVKINVVKFNQEKQRKLKLVSNLVSVISKIVQILSYVASSLVLVLAICVPFIIDKVTIQNNDLIINGTVVNTLQANSESTTTLIEAFNQHSSFELCLYAEIILISLLASMIILSFIASNSHKLFKNISQNGTPFTLDNSKRIKRITLLSIIYIVLPDLSGLLFQWATGINMDVELEIATIPFILAIICVYYIFDYGHQIQLDSKGKIYGKENA